ncbi:MAG: TIGR02147 family protein [Chitinispirillaceae bacterium]|nr:TIGR02147 family protein [Chitinispirillaceae bacterium]
MIDLFCYTDYCAYLRDFYEENRKKHPFFSYRFFGSKLGVDAGNLVKIIQGKRHLSSAGVKKFIEYAKLSGREAKYFETLVLFKKAKREQENKVLFEKLMAIQRIDPYRLEPMQYEFYREWYHTAILALLHTAPFNGDYKALGAATRPAISAKQAKESCELLMRLHLIRKERDGRLVPTNNVITTGEHWKSIAIRSFQEQSLKLAAEAFDRFRPEERDISTVTIAVTREDLEEIKKITSEYRRTVLQIASASDRADRVYQLNIQLFPLSART